MAEALSAEIDNSGVPPIVLLAQALERLIVTSPKRAVEVMVRHQEVLSTLENKRALTSLLCRGLTDKKLFKEGAEFIRVALRLKWLTESPSIVRFAKSLMQDGHMDSAARILRMALDNDPSDPAVVRGLYEWAVKSGDMLAAGRYLTRLTELDQSYSTYAFVYKERQKLPAAQGREVRIAILSSYVLDWLVPYLDDECRRAGISAQFYVAPFNQYMQDILSEGSALYGFSPDIVFMALAIEDVVPSLAEGPRFEDLKEVRSSVVQHVATVIREMESRCSAVLVLHELSTTHQVGYGILDNRLPVGIAPWIAEVNKTLSDELETHERAYLLPLDSVLSWVGKERSVNPKLSYMASMRLSESALAELARYSMRYIKPLKGLTRKCIVLDLDGTLWGGIVGEVGLDGVGLGSTAPGIEYVEFQRTLLGLSRRGILLAVCSKNNPEDALQVIRHHPHMVLREEHFAAMRINWHNKADNMREIAKELNIGLDSLVFIDDNPNERELIRQVLPEVMTVDLPKDASLYRRTIEALTDFELLALTKEDEARVAQYQAQSKRQAVKSSAASLEDYLRSLQIEIIIRRASRESLPRLVQLFNKTNQFNLTTRRYQTEEVAEFMASEDVLVYDLQVKDCFGDHGLVGAAVVRKERRTWRVDSLLMSCRVMGLGVETAFLERICSEARQGGGVTVIGEFIPTKKNHPVKEFYSQHGFVLGKETDNRQEWALDLAGSSLRKPEWVTFVQGDGQ